MTDLIDKHVLDKMKTDLGEETFVKLQTLFIEEMTEFYEKLQSAFIQNNTKTVDDVTHILKNTAALYGAIAVEKKAREINERLNLGEESTRIIAKNDIQLLTLIERTLQRYNNNGL